MAPHHAHSDIHSWSWRYVKFLPWFKWLFGVKAVKGYAHPITYWRNLPSTHPCPYCQLCHNQSVHGALGLCPATENPVVRAWLQAWGAQENVVANWRQNASDRDRFLLGKMALPVNLGLYLRKQCGHTHAKKSVLEFQRSVLSLWILLCPSGLPRKNCRSSHVWTRML